MLLHRKDMKLQREKTKMKHQELLGEEIKFHLTASQIVKTL